MLLAFALAASIILIALNIGALSYFGFLQKNQILQIFRF
jgi:hypothetical protein